MQSNHEAPGDAIRRYAAEPPGSAPPRGLLRAIARRLVPEPLRPVVRLLVTRLLAPTSRRHAARLVGAGELRLHLGCGDRGIAGWVNVDLAGSAVDLAWDLSRPLPFPACSAAVVFHEHLFEHLPLAAGLALTAECFRVLRPGGVLRVCVPDAGRYARAYAEGGTFLEETRPGRPTPMLAMQEVFYVAGHRTMYDFETLAAVLRAAGFADVEQRTFGEGRLRPNIDAPARAPESMYVEARKPGGPADA